MQTDSSQLGQERRQYAVDFLRRAGLAADKTLSGENSRQLSPSTQLVASIENRPLLMNHSSPHFKDTTDLISVADENPAGTLAASSMLDGADVNSFIMCREIPALENQYLGPQAISDPGTPDSGRRNQSNIDHKPLKVHGLKAYARSRGLLKLSSHLSHSTSMCARSALEQSKKGNRPRSAKADHAVFLRRNYE